MTAPAVLLLTVSACGGGAADQHTMLPTPPESTSTSEAVVGSTVVADTSTSSMPPPVEPAGSSAESTASGMQPVAAGTYRLRQAATTTSGGQKYQVPEEGLLVVDSPAKGRQVLHRYLDPDAAPDDSVLELTSAGALLREMTIRRGQIEVVCTFNAPVAQPPIPREVGSTSAGSAECGTFSVSVSSEITGAREVFVGEATFAAWVVESSVMTTGDLTSEAHQVDWFVDALGLSVHSESEASGTAGAVPFNTHAVVDLISATPF